MTLSQEQLKNIQLTVDDGKLDCAIDASGTYSCTAVTPVKNITGVCVDDQTSVAVTGRVEAPGGGGSPATPTITLNINGREYMAEDGMTWESWVISSYNTEEYYLGPQPFGDQSILAVYSKDGYVVVKIVDGVSYFSTSTLPVNQYSSWQLINTGGGS